ncbi:hypothetical protein [Ornithinimicrobium flavum]|uniref:hypothetical protein n=1 Tax=Ornithinimicrobium flavum TaxID=1288636 RepID=UPI0030844B12
MVIPEPGRTALPEETELILGWLESEGTRLVTLHGEWTCPVDGAGGSRAALEPQARTWGEVEWVDRAPARPLDRPVGAVPV